MVNKIANVWISNLGLLVSEATSLPTARTQNFVLLSVYIHRIIEIGIPQKIGK